VRVVSLVPSVTETLQAWGVVPAACTRFCERPDLPHVGGTKDPDIDAITTLRPDLVIVDVEENRREDHEALVQRGVPVHVLHIRGIGDLDEQLGGLATVLGSRWVPLGTLAVAAPRATVFVPIWRRPWMALGSPTYGTSLLAVLGLDNVYGDAGSYPATTLADARARKPDLVIAPSEPYPFAPRHRAELATVAPPVFVDGRDLLWWGARTRVALTRLADQLATDRIHG